jgi:uncharacterized protein YyaL (SSP411 family)
MKAWRNLLLSLAAVWLVALGVIFWARSAQPTAKSVADYLKKHPLTAESGSQRARTIGKVEDQLNRITFEERQELQRSGDTRRFFAELTPAEQSAFLDATLPSGFKQMMEAFNKMDPVARKKMVQRSLQQMREHQGDQRPPGTDDKLAQKMVDEGMRSFYSDANADVKLDLAPLIEQMQHNLQSPH